MNVLSVCMYVHCTHTWCTHLVHGVERGIRSPGLGMVGYEVPCWELSLPLHEQQVLLTTELLLQPLRHCSSP